MALELLGLARTRGRQNWWPADSPFEVAVGAVLVQNTNWRNVDLAIANLRSAALLVPSAILVTPETRLQELVRPAGFFRQKSATLHRLCRRIVEHNSLEHLLELELDHARALLMSVKGIGPETADSILLYAGGREIFVVDIYLRRWLDRHGYTEFGKLPYEALRLTIEETTKSEFPRFVELWPKLCVNDPRHTATAMRLMKRSLLADIYAELHAMLVADGIANKNPARVRRAERREQ